MGATALCLTVLLCVCVCMCFLFPSGCFVAVLFSAAGQKSDNKCVRCFVVFACRGLGFGLALSCLVCFGFCKFGVLFCLEWFCFGLWFCSVAI